MSLLIRIAIILLSIPLGWGGPAWAEAQPREARQGILDATGWDFQKGSLPLCGQWMFHWKKLYTSEDIKAADTPAIDLTPRVAAKDQFQIMEACFVLGMFFLLVISNVSLFILRPEDKPSLLLAGFSLIMGLRFFGAESLLTRIFTESTLLNFGLIIYPNALAFPLGFAMYFHFFHLAFPGYFPRRAVQIGWATALTYKALLFTIFKEEKKVA